MAVRTTAADLILRLRRLISDPAGAEQVFSDRELQDVLDGRRREVAQYALEGVPSYPGGVLTYLEFAAPWSDWEADCVLQDSSLATITPEGSDLMAGRWTFATEPSYPVYLSGKTFDLNGAAADALEQWAARKALEFDFSPGKGSFQRSQQFKMLGELAERYRRQARPRTAAMVREDVNPGIGPDGVPENWRR